MNTDDVQRNLQAMHDRTPFRPFHIVTAGGELLTVDRRFGFAFNKRHLVTESSHGKLVRVLLKDVAKIEPEPVTSSSA